MFRVAVFQHTPAEPFGYIEYLLSEWHVPLDYQELWQDFLFGK